MNQQNPLSDHLRTQIWESMLTADMNCRYYWLLQQKYSRYDNITKYVVILALLVEILNWGFFNFDPNISKLSTVTALALALVSPIFNFQILIESMADLASIWFEIKQDYEKLWSEAQSNSSDANDLQDSFTNVNSQERNLLRRAVHLPDDDRLLGQAQDQVLAGKGLNN